MIPQHVNCDYVARHIFRIENTFRNNPRMQADSRYRIANHSFGAYSDDGSLTESEKAQLKEFIADFYASEAGNAALANKNNRW